jgi:hypothetical protein
LAKVIAYVGIICSIIDGIILIIIGFNSWNGELFIGLGFGVIILGSLFSWITAWFMYGFGTLIENTESIKNNTSKESKYDQMIQEKKSGANENNNSLINKNELITMPKTENKKNWLCSTCGTENIGDGNCQNC